MCSARTDYDEIVWYVPALDELAFLRERLEAGTIKFLNSDERFHSSTPYLAGYTAEVPGRAFYVKMGQGKKAFAMRDRPPPPVQRALLSSQECLDGRSELGHRW